MRKLEKEIARFKKLDKEYRTIFENSTDLIFVINKDYRVTSVNPQGAGFLGKKPEEVVGKLISQLFPEEISNKYLNSLKNVFNTGVSATYDSQISAKKGKYWINTHLSSIKDNKGEVIAVIGVSRDITERKHSEKALKENEEKLRNFIEYTTLGIWCFQPEKPVDINLPEDQMIDAFFKSTCIECNEPYASMMGVTKEKILGLKLSDAMPDTDENRDYLRSFIQNEFKLSGGISRELTEGGEEKYFSNSMVGIIKNGELIHAWGTQIDITKQKQAEEALKKSKEELYQVQKLEGIGQLAGGIAHDINNILTAIIGNTELALMGLEKGKNIRNHLEQVISSGRNGGELVSKILAFSHRQIIYPIATDVNSTILNLAKTLPRMINEDIKVKMKLGENIATIKADPAQIEQILINLAVNARDAINQKNNQNTKKVMTIETSEVFLEEDFVSSHVDSNVGKHILISVTDNGIGMDKETVNRIFEPFFTTKEKGKGTGLGLSTVYGIVKQNQGSIYIYSESGKGTSVKIYWPVFFGKTRIEEKVKGNKIKGGRETILFVEDDDKIRKTSEQLLVSYGYTLFSSLNGKLALDLVKNKKVKIDLLVTDVVMPEMGGIELFEKLRKTYSGLKVVYCSGYPDNHLVSSNGILKKDVNFISKPYSGKELAKKIRTVLDE